MSDPAEGQYEPIIVSAGDKVLYLHRTDEALWLSRWVNGLFLERACST